MQSDFWDAFIHSTSRLYTKWTKTDHGWHQSRTVHTTFTFTCIFFPMIWQVSLSSGHMFDRDVELLFYYQDAHKPTAIVEVGQESTEPGNGILTWLSVESFSGRHLLYPRLWGVKCGDFNFQVKCPLLFFILTLRLSDEGPHCYAQLLPRIPSFSDVLTCFLWGVYFRGGPLGQYGLQDALWKRCQDAHRQC